MLAMSEPVPPPMPRSPNMAPGGGDESLLSRAVRLNAGLKRGFFTRLIFAHDCVYFTAATHKENCISVFPFLLFCPPPPTLPRFIRGQTNHPKRLWRLGEVERCFKVDKIKMKRKKINQTNPPPISLKIVPSVLKQQLQQQQQKCDLDGSLWII